MVALNHWLELANLVSEHMCEPFRILLTTSDKQLSDSMEQPPSYDQATPLSNWLETVGCASYLEHDAFQSLLTDLVEQMDDDLDASRRGEVALSPADSVRRPDSRLPRIRRAFQKRWRDAHSRAWPAVDREFKDTRVVNKVLADIDAVRVDLGVPRARRHLVRTRDAAPPPGEATPRKFRQLDAGCGEQRYQRILSSAAAEVLGSKEGLGLEEARELLKRTANLASRSPRTAAGLERGAFRQLGPLGHQELVALLDAGGGALGHWSRGQGRLDVQRPWADPTAVTQRCEQRPKEVQLEASAGFGQPPPWAAVTSRGRPSHRRWLREQLRQEAAPPSVTALHDNVTFAQVAKSVLSGDAAQLRALEVSNSLWRGPNPSIIIPELQEALGTRSCRFPLLFAAAYAGDLANWELLTGLLARHEQLLPHLVEDVEGWYLPAILCMSPPELVKEKRSIPILRSYFRLLNGTALPHRPLSCCLLLPREEHWEGDAAAQPSHLLLCREAWSELVTLLVAHGGVQQEEEPARMALVGRILAERGHMKDFLVACARGGECPRPQGQAFAGLYLGILKSSVPVARCLAALQALLEHGLAPAEPLTPAREQWPLHAAARHDCAAAAQVLLVAKADPFMRNVRGLTALDAAKASRSWATVDALRRGCPFPKPRKRHLLLVAEALAKFQEELHGQICTEKVAEALLQHLEGLQAAQSEGMEVVTEDEDIVARALAGMLSAQAERSSPPGTIQEHKEVDSGHFDPAHADLVAGVLSRMVLAASPREDAESACSDLQQDRAGGVELASALAQEATQQAAGAPKSDACIMEDEDLMAKALPSMLSAQAGASSGSGTVQEHEEVDSGHSDPAHAEIVASVLSPMVLAAAGEEEPAASASMGEPVAVAEAKAAVQNLRNSEGT
ncbi:unnamed protein product [Effrenium voratum]|nr:unnamed protein product [Effrenium voratum]